MSKSILALGLAGLIQPPEARAQGWNAGAVPVGAVFTSQTFITRHLATGPTGTPNPSR